MKKPIMLFLMAGAFTFSACREDAGTSTETNDNDSSTPDRAEGEYNDSTSAYHYDFERESRERANRLSSQISQDLRLDAATQARIRTVMYNRARQMNELETRFTSTNRSAGLASDSGSMISQDLMVDRSRMVDSGAAIPNTMEVTGYPEDYPNRYYNEIESINSNVDMEVKGFLTPEQFKAYEANRQKYYTMDNAGKTGEASKLKIEGEEAKLKSGDFKLKREGEELKLKTDNMKIKREGDEMKIKTDDAKLKREGNEVKYKSGDTKIKMEN